MKTRDIFSYSFSAIKLRKLRAFLTTLGVIIGIAAIVGLLSITQGLQNTITNEFSQGLATNTLIVSISTGGGFGGGGGGFGGGQGGGGSDVQSGGLASSNFKLYVNYTNNLNSTLDPGIESSFAVITQAGYLQVGDKIRQVNTITGVDFAAYNDVYGTSFKAAQGTISLTPAEDDVVVGARVSDPRLNGTIFVNAGDNPTVIWTNASQLPFMNQTYTGHIAAVMQQVGGFSFVGPSDTGMYMPLTKAQSFFGTDEASMIIVKLTSSDKATIDAATKAITKYFDNQVTVTSPTAVIDVFTNIVGILGIFVSGIAAISLLVAGIGIMNIMIVSLIERTREIGILKALGMRKRTVLSIFLGESLFIGLIGAIGGIIAGWVLGQVVAFGVERMVGVSGLTLNPVLTPVVVLGALGFGVAVSVIFALYPAWRASKLKPVDALRYE